MALRFPSSSLLLARRLATEIPFSSNSATAFYIDPSFGAGGNLYSRVGEIVDADIFRLEYHLYGSSTIASGATVTKYPNDGTPNMTPGAAGVLNSGLGSGADSNIPTDDFNGNPRSTSTPDIGAIEVA